jgi:hypothetical protein
MDQYVVCVQREEPSDKASRIVGVGVAASPRATAREVLSVDEVVHRREAGIDHFFVERDDYDLVEVYPHIREGTLYLATSPDGRESGNLGELETCGDETPLAAYIRKRLTAANPEVSEKYVRLVDLGLEAITGTAVAFHDEHGDWIVPLAAVPGMVIEDVKTFLWYMRGLGTLMQNAETMAESFRGYQIGTLKRDPSTLTIYRTWPPAKIRVTVDLAHRDPEQMPTVTAIGAVLVKENGEPWREGDPPESARIRWTKAE